uniref:Uncharacterized protein n=1 Tax=Arundo donax TaxID=35708 RepID=A0A0A8ZLK5_ARUDO
MEIDEMRRSRSIRQYILATTAIHYTQKQKPLLMTIDDAHTSYLQCP